ncbi:MAG: outer membrane protein assembly factor BamD [Deltaproteobacteria bacterium]|nr:outer membrane protein assembly factor BamD [Deltaproteobacteria bacterium]
MKINRKNIGQSFSGGLPLWKALALFLAFTIAGCAGVKDMQGKRDPKELYDKAMTHYLGQMYNEAESGFKTLMEEHPLSPYSVEAQLMLGDVCYASEKYEDASSYYTNFVALHPTHQKAPYALFQKGMSHFRDVLTIDRDQTSTRKALFAFEDLAAAYPGSAYHSKAKELIGFLKKRLAEREFYVARFYFKDKNYKGALARFRDILKNYPEAGFNDSALYYIGESYERLGEKNLANDAFSTLISNFPDSPYVKEVRTKLKES